MSKFSFMLCAVCVSAGMLSSAQAAPLKDEPPVLLAMGPDPGGHTGAGVTPETTKTDRAQVDAARQAASGSKVESNQTGGEDSAKDSARTATSDRPSRRRN